MSPAPTSYGESSRAHAAGAESRRCSPGRSRSSPGPVGLATKYVLLALANAVGLWAFTVLLADGRWIVAASVAFGTAAIDVVYLSRGHRPIPMKFLMPGTILLILFQIIPIVYNATIAFSNYSTGHVQTKEEAIQTIKEASLAPPANGRTYTMTPAEQDGELVLLLVRRRQRQRLRGHRGRPRGAGTGRGHGGQRRP